MAVVIGSSDRGALIYRSINGLDISEDERDRADKLDISICEALSSLETDLGTEGEIESREKVSVYWHLGNILNRLLADADLVAAEKPYFFLNVKYRIPDIFKAKDRGPNRQHLVYCYRLGTYPREIALQLKWSEWSYLFDSSGINAEPRFDVWFSEALAIDKTFFDRTNVRLLGKVLNCFFTKMETSDLSDDEIMRCFEAARYFCQSAQIVDDKEITMHALRYIKQNRMIIAQILDQRMPVKELFRAATQTEN